MSRPHSGSTILDILLGNSAAIAGVGQLVSDMGKLDNPCACGSTIRDCPFWLAVRARVEAEGIGWDEAVQASVGQAHLRRLPATAWAGPDDPALRRLALITAAVTRAIAAESGKPVVLDSSKEPTRALFLLKYYPEAVMLRLVRDPRGAVGSHYWRLKDLGYFHFLRRDYHLPQLTPVFLVLAAASWLVGNLIHDRVARVAPERVVRIRYEDLRDRPEAELAKLGRELDLPLAEVAERLQRGEELAIGHLIGGNDVRLEQGLRFEPGRERSRRALPRWVELLTVALCWPLMWRYGYALSRAASGPVAARPSES